MTARDRLHRLVDELSEDEVETAERVLQDLAGSQVRRSLDTAPPDDEPDDDDFDGGLTEARAEPSIPHEQVRPRLLAD